MPLASPPAQPCFELNEVYFRRAWGMTAKAHALPDSGVAGVSPCSSSPEINRPARAGMGNLKNRAEQQAGYGERGNGIPFKKTRHGKNSHYPRSGRYWRDACQFPAGGMTGERLSNNQAGRGGAINRRLARECGAESRGLGESGASRKAHLCSTEGQRSG